MRGESIATVLVLAALAVLVITHPGGFATDVTSGGSFVDKTLGLLSCSGVQGGVNYPTAAKG